MISFFITITVAFFLFIGLILKLCNVTMTKSANRFICWVLPILCITMFVAMLFESSFKRKTQLRELNTLISIVENSMNSNRVFESDEEKYRCLDSLSWQEQLLSRIAFEDSLVSILTSRDTLIESRVRLAENVIRQQTKRIKRLNNFYKNEVNIDSSMLDLETIRLVAPVTDKLTTWNFAFRCTMDRENIVCAYVQIISKDTIVYQKAFEYNEDINCFVTPHTPDSNEIIKVGYILKNNNINEFRYITYACNY